MGPRTACGEEQDNAFTVGEVGISRQVVSGTRALALANTIDVSDCFKVFRFEQILDQIIAGFIHFGIDPMCRQVPGLGREPDTDVATDLPDPDRLSPELQRRQP